MKGVEAPLRALVAALAAWLVCACSVSASAVETTWPVGTEVLAFEKLEGLILVHAKLLGESERDTSGPLVLDTGAGFLTLDARVGKVLGVDANPSRSLGFANRPLRRLSLGSLQIDLVTPVTTFDLESFRGVTDRPILGLLGERLFHGRALAIDYQDESIAIIPAPADEATGLDEPSAGDGERTGAGLTGEGSSRARRSLQESDDAGRAIRVAESRERFRAMSLDRATPIPFRLAGDGKILLRVRISAPKPPRFGPWKTLVLDTGATKSVLFVDSAAGARAAPSSWKSLRGISAQNILGATEAMLARVPAIEIETENAVMRDTNVVFGVMRSGLARMLERSVGEPVHGVLGYSLLQRYRVLIDYPRRVLWLDPVAKGWNDRPFEYTHIGIQIERAEGNLRVRAIAEGSPAEAAGVERGDELLAIDGRELEGLDLVAVTRLLEGSQGTTVRVELRRGAVVQVYDLVRRQLL